MASGNGVKTVRVRAVCRYKPRTHVSEPHFPKKPGHLIQKKHIVEYSGSPDSEVIANLLDGFQYRPEKSKEILSQYR